MCVCEEENDDIGQHYLCARALTACFPSRGDAELTLDDGHDFNWFRWTAETRQAALGEEEDLQDALIGREK